MKNRQWLLARRPNGAIQDSDFNLVETEAPIPGEGEVLVRNTMLSCDPTQRGWIAFDTYLPAVKIGEVVRSIGVGRIVASNNPGFAVGDIVATSSASRARLAMRGRIVLCGGIANYNATEPPPGPKNYLNLIVQRGRMEGFIVLDYLPRAAEAVGALAGWVHEGKLKSKVDTQHG